MLPLLVKIIFRASLKVRKLTDLRVKQSDSFVEIASCCCPRNDDKVILLINKGNAFLVTRNPLTNGLKEPSN